MSAAKRLVYLFFLGGLRLIDLKVQFSAGQVYLWPSLLLLTVVILVGGRYRARNFTKDKTLLREELNEGPLFGALFELVQRPYIIPIIIFILLYKLADTSMGFMVKPFWVDSGFSATEIGLVSVNI